MTDPVDEAIWRTGFTVLSAAERDTHVCHFLSALNLALEATKLAIEAAREAPRTASLEHPTQPQTFERWAAANLSCTRSSRHSRRGRITSSMSSNRWRRRTESLRRILH
jgi:hypothetical protein